MKQKGMGTTILQYSHLLISHKVLMPQPVQYIVLLFKSAKSSITLSRAFHSGTKHKSDRTVLTQGSKTHLICEFSVGRSRAEVVHNAREAVPHTYVECCFSLLSPQVKVSLNNDFLYYHSLFTTDHLHEILASYHFNYSPIKAKWHNIKYSKTKKNLDNAAPFFVKSFTNAYLR